MARNVLSIIEEVLSMSRTDTGTMDSDGTIRLLTRQRNRNRVLVIAVLVLIFAAFGIATTLMYLNP
jgi:hypothetical protein